MGIILEENYKGITANYWRIDSFQYDDLQDKVIVDIRLYANKESAVEGNSLTREVIQISGIKEIAIPEGDFGTPRNLLKTMLYQRIMEDGKFKNGVSDED